VTLILPYVVTRDKKPFDLQKSTKFKALDTQSLWGLRPQTQIAFWGFTKSRIHAKIYSFITGGAPPVRLLSRNMGCGVWGVGKQGRFKEVFLSFIGGGVPPVGRS